MDELSLLLLKMSIAREKLHQNGEFLAQKAGLYTCLDKIIGF
jgi:hypothetical protein